MYCAKPIRLHSELGLNTVEGVYSAEGTLALPVPIKVEGSAVEGMLNYLWQFGYGLSCK
jgi:hypothetical protein